MEGYIDSLCVLQKKVSRDKIHFFPSIQSAGP